MAKSIVPIPRPKWTLPAYLIKAHRRVREHLTSLMPPPAGIVQAETQRQHINPRPLPGGVEGPGHLRVGFCV